MKKNWTRRIVVLLLAVTMTCSMTVPCLAYYPTNCQVRQTIRQIDRNAAKKGELSASGSIISSLIKEFAKAAGIAAVKWGTDRFLNSLFGEDDGMDYMSGMLEDIAARQNEIIDKLNACSDLIKTTAYQDILREYQRQSTGTAWLVRQCTATLKYIDEQYDGKFVDGELPEEVAEQIKQDRLTALTRGIGISVYESATEAIDTRVGDLYNMIMTTYDVPVGSKPSVQRNFFQVYKEKMRLTTHWEHLAYDSMEQFNNNMVANYLSAAMLETASLKARYELCKQEGRSTQSLEVRLANLYEEVAEVAKLYNGNKVYRDNEWAHFWVPDHEVYLNPKAIQQYIPGEVTGDAGNKFCNAHGYCTSTSNIPWDFWNSLYQPYRTSHWSTTYVYPKMASTADINNLLDGCNHSMTLAEILEEGGIANIPKNAVLVLDKNDSKSPVEVVQKTDWGAGYSATFTYVYPRGVKMSQKTAITKADRINTYEYADEYSSAGWGGDTSYTVNDKRAENQNYFTLGVKCDHSWDVHWKGLNELGDCTKCGASYINTEALSDVKPVPTTSVKSIKGICNGIKLTWNKQTVSGYQIRYSLNKNMKNYKTVTINKMKTTSKKITKLKAGKKYYVKIRCFNEYEGKKSYSKWSKVKTVKTK